VISLTGSEEPDSLKVGERIMGREATAALYVVLMAATIVALDILFFKNRFWERLTVNVGIVLVFAAFYWRFLKHP
jgi:hypothetical protein